MNRLGKKLTALLLALCLLLGLAACGSGDDKGGDSQISGTVYVPTFAGLDTTSVGIQYMNGRGCAGEQYFYFTAQVQGEEHENTWTDPDTGEEEVSTYYDYKEGIFRAPLEGGAVEELTGYESPAPATEDEDSETYVYITDLSAGVDGTLWITESVEISTFDLPEDFDEETDDKWNYQTYESTSFLRQLDANGAELSRVDLTNLAESAGLDFTYGMLVDESGNIYVNSDTAIAVLDKDQNLLFTLEGENLWGSMIFLGDGSVGLSGSYYDEEKQSGGYKMRTVDFAGQAWGPEYELSQSAYQVYPGGGDYLFYYQNNDSVYGVKTGSTLGEKIFSWIDASVNRSNVQFCSFLPDGRVAAMTQEWNPAHESSDFEAVILTPTDASTLPERTTLTYACMGLGYDVRNMIIEFNKTSDKYRIEVTDYGEFNTGEDSSAGLTKMNTEILGGHVPDLMDASSSMPIQQYAAKGLLEDLWPYIEGDQEIGGREGVMENALKAAEQNGKLYQIFKQFDIRTVVGAADVVGDRNSWTLADLQAALAQMPEGCSIFGQTDTRDGMLNNILACNMDNFVNWADGTCSFDSDSFKSLLSFCSSFPEEFDWESVDWDTWEEEEQRIAGGKQMLRSIYLDRFISVAQNKAVFGGDISCVGYPMEDGSCGSSFQIMGSSFAMSSTCKDKEGVWSFIRQLLLSESGGEDYYLYDFPVNKKDFEWYMNDSMTIKYVTDENGEPVKDENGEPIMESKASYWIGPSSDSTQDSWKEIYAATQEEVDQVMDLYNSITTLWTYDDNIYKIIQEAVGPYFAGDRTLDDTATRIQSAVKLYIGEQS